MGGFNLTNLATPVFSGDAANKAYVDAATPGVVSLIQERPSGTINGVNTVFTTSQLPVASNSVTLYMDGGILAQGPGLDYGVSGNTLTLTAAPVAGQFLWVAYNGNLASIPIWNLESFTLAAPDITNQYVTLAHAVNPLSVRVSVEGLGQQNAVDYNLSVVGGVTRLAFAGNLATGGSTPLVSGNIIYVQYQY